MSNVPIRDAPECAINNPGPGGLGGTQIGITSGVACQGAWPAVVWFLQREPLANRERRVGPPIAALAGRLRDRRSDEILGDAEYANAESRPPHYDPNLSDIGPRPPTESGDGKCQRPLRALPARPLPAGQGRFEI